MSNVRRLRLGDCIFFATVNLRQALPPFTPAEFALILQSIEESRCRLGFALCGYVLMPDHWHALLWPSGTLTISRAVQDIKYVSARRINRSRRTQGSLWQHQFWDRFVRHAREFSQRLEYMHMNPVRKGLVAKEEEWQWSSYKNFTLDESERAACPIQIDYVLLPDNYRA